MAEFPEDRVELLAEYVPPKLDQILAAISRCIATDPVDVVKVPSNRPARTVNDARKLLARFLGHGSFVGARQKLGLGDEELGVYDAINQRQFQLALNRINQVPRDSSVPAVTVDDFTTALRRSSMVFFLDKTKPGPPGSEPEQILEQRTLPGYDGPELSTVQVRGLVVLGELIRGGPERDWRLGLLRAESRKGLRQFKEAIDEYGKLLVDPDSGPTKRKFLAIRAGLVRVAKGDARYRAARRLDQKGKVAAAADYRAAIDLTRTHKVSFGHPLRKEIVRHAEQQLAKLDAGINFLGVRDSFVPVARFGFLRERIESHQGDAQDAVDRFERYLSRANELEDLSQELALELATAKRGVEIAAQRAANAASRVRQIDNQIEAISDQHDFLVATTLLENVGDIFGAASGSPGDMLGLVSAGVGFAARHNELGHQRESAEIEREIAEREQTIARLEEEIAKDRRDFVQNRFDTTGGRRLNKELYYELARRFEQLAELHLDAAVRFAFLYERAVAFFLGQPGLEVITGFDYRDPNGELFTAAGDLGADVDRITEQFGTAKEDVFFETFSLRSEYPIEFGRFLQTGVMEFAISLYQLDKRRPGTHQVRIVEVKAEIRGLVPPTGFSGDLTHMGRFLLRDRQSTLDPGTVRLIPTDEELAAAFQRQEQEGTAQAAVGGVIPYALDPDTIQLNTETLAGGTDESQEFLLRLFEGYGPTGLWRLELRDVNLAFISDIFLRFTLKTVETDIFELKEKVETLVARYEEELAGGDVLDRIHVVALRQRFPDAFDGLATGTAAFPLREEDFDEAGASVKTVVAQALDPEGAGVGGVGLEISKPGTGFVVARVTGPDGFSEDFDAGFPPVEPPGNRPPAAGTWQIRLTDPAQSGALGELRLFFVYAIRQV